MENLDIKKAFILTYKLVHTLKSKSFSKRLLSDWACDQSNENMLAIQNKAKNAVKSKLNSFNRSESFDIILGYLDHLASEKEINVKKAEVKGLIKNISVDEYRLTRSFIYKVSAQYRKIFHSSGQFYCHELVGEILDYLLIKDGLENGTGLAGLDEIIKTLIAVKPSSFFSDGYINDLFISDRLQISDFPFEVAALRCNRSYLSTCLIATNTYQEKDLVHYELFKVT
jgi:hypothetical protein